MRIVFLSIAAAALVLPASADAATLVIWAAAAATSS
jgi:hypothetical protein